MSGLLFLCELVRGTVRVSGKNHLTGKIPEGSCGITESLMLGLEEIMWSHPPAPWQDHPLPFTN